MSSITPLTNIPQSTIVLIQSWWRKIKRNFFNKQLRWNTIANIAEIRAKEIIFNHDILKYQPPPPFGHRCSKWTPNPKWRCPGLNVLKFKGKGNTIIDKYYSLLETAIHTFSTDVDSFENKYDIIESLIEQIKRSYNHHKYIYPVIPNNIFKFHSEPTSISFSKEPKIGFTKN
jgi:hypothetical protein